MGKAEAVDVVVFRRPDLRRRQRRGIAATSRADFVQAKAITAICREPKASRP